MAVHIANGSCQVRFEASFVLQDAFKKQMTSTTNELLNFSPSDRGLPTLQKLFSFCLVIGIDVFLTLKTVTSSSCLLISSVNCPFLRKIISRIENSNGSGVK